MRPIVNGSYKDIQKSNKQMYFPIILTLQFNLAKEATLI
jgi:hypothetical protein